MDWLWNWGGECFGYRDGESLFAYFGKEVGRFDAEASLGLTAVVASSQQSEPGFYLLYLNRSRSDALRGGFSGLARGQVKRSARDGMQKNMLRIKFSIESLWVRSEKGD